MAADPFGATELNTGEFLLGKVLVTPVFLESNGEVDAETQNWDEQEIDNMLAKISEGVNWWSTALSGVGTVHTLDFVIDDTFAKDPFETRFEPIDRTSGTYADYVGDFFTAQQLGDSPSLERAAKLFNHAQREKFDTDWAFTIFVADSSDDPDGSFASGGQFSSAFAFAGGLFFITPSTRPASTISHELGHIFWARDEYPNASSYTDRRGYYNAQNLNAADNPNVEQQNSIMRGGTPLGIAFDSFTSPESTLALVGWRDSDSDGIFDVADVPLDLDIVSYFDPANSTVNVSGSASAVPLINQNSSGVQSDITLNRVSELQFRIDSGNWQTFAEPDSPETEIDLTIPINGTFDTIEIRAIDTASGVTSPVVMTTTSEHGISDGGIRGFTFFDENANDQRDLPESFLPGTQVLITHQDGSALFNGSANASDFDTGQLPALIDGVTLTADGSLLNNQLQSLDSANAGNVRVFQAFDTQRNEFVDGWSESAVFEAQFDEVVGTVSLETIGLSTGHFDIGSYARIEAYDSDGLLITRTTSDLIAVGATKTVTVEDPHGRISRIRAFGHASTDVAISSIQFGSTGQVTVGANGSWQIDNLATGDYEVQFSTQNVIHHADPINVQVDAGNSALVVAAVDRVDSPRHNTIVAADVDRDSFVTARDALLVINDIHREGTRTLVSDESTGHKIDVNNDGVISALDALVVINTLNDTEADGEGEQLPAAKADSAIAGFNTPSHEQWTDELESKAFPVDWLFDDLGQSGLFNSAGRGVDDESNVDRTADTRSDGVAQAIFSSSLKTNEPVQQDLKTANSGNKKLENVNKHVKTASLGNHIESNLSEPIVDTRV